MMHTQQSSRGFALLVAIIFTAVILAVSLALLDISYKQILLASAAKQSQYAFYNADSALECALEQDSFVPSGQTPRFDFTSGATSGNFTCEGQNITYFYPTNGGNPRTGTFNVTCNATATTYNAQVVVYKLPTGATYFYSNGFNNCNTNDPFRVERGIKASY